MQTDIFKYGSTQNNEIIREFIDFENNRLLVRSPSFAKAILREAVDDSVLISLFSTVIFRLDRLREDNRIFDEPTKQMVRFGFIEGILSDDNGKAAKLVSYYEAIRATGVGISNPQFWLQYAIACMSFQNYADASNHFDTAFGLAKSRGGYDPYQIENQYARFLLESRSKTDIWEDYYDALSRAHDIIQRQMSSFKEGYYPYRVARSYLDYVDVRLTTMDKAQQTKVKEWCEQLIALSTKAPPVVRRSVYWRDARSALQAAIDYINESLHG